MSIFPKSGYKILKLIYHNPGIRLSDLIRQARVSVETSKKRLHILLKINIIKEEKIVGGKRTLIKSFFPNLESEEGIGAFCLIETEKRLEFLKKNKSLVGPFRQLLKNANEKIKIILIFGSFATNSQTKDSDLDVLFLASGKIDSQNLKKEIERSFVTFEHEISPRIDSMERFEKNLNKEIYQSVMRNHIIIRGSFEYIKSIAKASDN